jgi:hypothetical protein
MTPPVEIAELDWDPTNVGKLARHGIIRREVDGLVNRGVYTVRVHRGYPDQVRITGATAAGRLLTVALELVDEERSLWRPVTGWEATADEEAYYWRENR